MIVLGSDNFAERLAKHLNATLVPVEKRAFPDGEVCPRIVGDVDNHAIVAERLSLPLDPNRYLIETLFIT
ncbi:MAG: hypothetical protein V1900_01725, partial [Candidatus Aenigmatarchaeota archaeon]